MDVTSTRSPLWVFLFLVFSHLKMCANTDKSIRVVCGDGQTRPPIPFSCSTRCDVCVVCASHMAREVAERVGLFSSTERPVLYLFIVTILFRANNSRKTKLNTKFSSGFVNLNRIFSLFLSVSVCVCVYLLMNAVPYRILSELKFEFGAQRQKEWPKRRGGMEAFRKIVHGFAFC